MGGFGVGLASGILKGLGKGITESDQRQTDLRNMGLQATMQMYAELMKEAAPEARSDIMKAGIDAVRSVVAPRHYKKEHNGQKGGPSDPLGILRAKP